jgi:uncharacterized membrane protein YphA (DoxX/SURF4 family)
METNTESQNFDFYQTYRGREIITAISEEGYNILYVCLPTNLKNKIVWHRVEKHEDELGVRVHIGSQHPPSWILEKNVPRITDREKISELVGAIDRHIVDCARSLRKNFCMEQEEIAESEEMFLDDKAEKSKEMMRSIKDEFQPILVNFINYIEYEICVSEKNKELFEENYKQKGYTVPSIYREIKKLQFKQYLVSGISILFPLLFLIPSITPFVSVLFPYSVFLAIFLVNNFAKIDKQVSKLNATKEHLSEFKKCLAIYSFMLPLTEIFSEGMKDEIFAEEKLERLFEQIRSVYHTTELKAPLSPIEEWQHE